MLDRSFVIGISHKNAPLVVREKLGAISEVEVLESVSFLSEAMVLSTCNRYEIYAMAPSGLNVSESIDAIHTFLRDKAGLPLSEWLEISFVKTGEDMLRHGFQVSSSLESMVLGEPQILGQMKNAYNISKEGGYLKGFLERFCHASFRVGKRVRTETEIAQKSVSVASTAVRLALDNVEDIASAHIVFLGAGDMTVAALKYLEITGVPRLTIVNRTVSRAQQVADDYESRTGSCVSVASMDDLVRVLSTADAVVAATSSLIPVVTDQLMAEVMALRGRKPLTLVDIAVPRDVARNVDVMDNVMVLDIDALGRAVDQAKRARLQQVSKAETIVDEEVTAFVQWNESQKNAHMVRYLREHAEAVRQQVLQKYTSDDADEATRLLMNKFLHMPLKAIQEGHASAGSMEHLVSLLFGIRCPRRVQLLPSDENSTTKQGCPFVQEMIKTTEHWNVCPVAHHKAGDKDEERD